MVDELARLKETHKDLDRRLKELESHRWLSAEEEAEVGRLKRAKLAAKDQIARLEKTGPAEARG